MGRGPGSARAGQGAGAGGAGAGSARRRCGVGLPRFARAPREPRSLWDLGWGARVDSRAPAALVPPRGGAGCAAGGSTLPSRGWKGRGLYGSPSPRPRCAPREAARLAGGARLGWPVPAPAPHPGTRGLGARGERQPAGPGASPVPTIRVSHGWSEVLFLKRLQGGHKLQLPSLCALWTVNPVWGRGPGRCTWWVERAGGQPC